MDFLKSEIIFSKPRIPDFADDTRLKIYTGHQGVTTTTVLAVNVGGAVGIATMRIAGLHETFLGYCSMFSLVRWIIFTLKCMMHPTEAHWNQCPLKPCALTSCDPELLVTCLDVYY
ncbi:hypothetical protein CPB84DRAFT_1789532 [Gymnopilus junonius]|uniref:Uncharacterized protein n=1 Tax=Gymnopilus junonius TaxID=109634 RepID=A0A9P5TI94_GYMJU|nr:hypothetical protein CPB84DRAFT_1789532 [Gymnopilus junonius]